jgi:hypothetical protein
MIKGKKIKGSQGKTGKRVLSGEEIPFQLSSKNP